MPLYCEYEQEVKIENVFPFFLFKKF